ncbi:ParA family protein [Myxococcus xanthus]|uniref:ParA family protein n=1 Tax=Myxococcus xanthus TaxID=34 RepID=UPI00191E087F|nr:ParA family protein [Myxococcus xanthus]
MKSRYALWNNKGGVGKTFLSFTIATEYARQNPEKTIYVIDMCPQANISEIILGGNGKGAKNLSKLLQSTPRITIGGYFDERIDSPNKKTGTEASFAVDAHSHNKGLPKNVRLVAGDPSLEIQAQAMNQIAGQNLPKNVWSNVFSWLRDLVSEIEKQHEDCAFFIDCNPSFSAYTGAALLAADRLIVPCTADGSSARAIDNIGGLLYGVGVPQQYSGASFYHQVSNHGMSVPKIHVVPLNRSTQYDNKASKAFRAMYKEIKKRVAGLHSKQNKFFSSDPSVGDTFIDVPDAHAVSVVVSHKGIPLQSVSVGRHDVHGVKTMVNKGPLERYRKALEKLVGLL